ncbi:MAG: hypothetical protein J6Z30_06350, partial [Pyramidobacter sp.]|nr:hypothetical protein [Pyramidobacter sp.]
QTQEFDWWSDSWKDSRSTQTEDKRRDDVETTLLPGGTVMTIVDFINKLFNEKWDRLSDEDKRYFKDLRDHPEKGDAFYTLRFEDLISTTATVKPANWPAGDDWNYNVSYNNWTHFAGKISRTAITSYGKQITITNAIKADNPIAVSIRESTKPGFITINAPKADVMLTDALKSNAAAGEVSVTAKNIIANENALIYSNTVKLKAAETIGDKRSSDPVRITPIDDVADVKAEAGKSGKDGVEGIVNLAVLGGAASVDLASAGGSVTLKADGAITGKAEGADIDLGSDAGSIGSADLAFAIVGEGDSQLAAYANDTINIAKDKGDLKVVCVETPGDATLETKSGSIVDAHPVKRDGALTDDEMVEIWKSAGIISSDADGSSVTAAMRREGLANMEALIRSDYAAYQSAAQTLKTVNKQLAGADLSKEQKATLTAQKNFLEKQIAYLSLYENVTSVDSYIAEQKATKGTDLYELSQIDPEKTGGFTKDYLLYAVQDSILNPGPGTVMSDVAPFILGRTVTLRSSPNIGSEDPEKKIKGGADLIKNGMAGLKALSAANPADVTWNDDTGEFIINETHEIGVETDEVTARAKGMILIASPNQNLVINSVESTGGGKVHLMAGGDVRVSDRSTADAAV